MPTSFECSTAVQTAILTGLYNIFNGACVLRIYGGTTPVDANDALGAAVLLREVSNNGTGTELHFESAPVNGMLVKSNSETWSGVNVATGTAVFYRLVLLTDTGVSSTTEPRLQGSVGLLDSDLILGSISLVSGVTDPSIGQYYIGMPTE